MTEPTKSLPNFPENSNDALQPVSVAYVQGELVFPSIPIETSVILLSKMIHRDPCSSGQIKLAAQFPAALSNCTGATMNMMNVHE